MAQAFQSNAFESTAFEASAGAASQDLAPALYTNSSGFFTQAVTVGAVTLTPALYTATNSFFSPSVANVGGLAQTLTPSLYSNSNGFYTQTMTTGAVTLTPSLFTSTTNGFQVPVVTRGAVTLTPALFTSTTNGFFAQTVSPGAVTLTPARYSNSPAFYTAVVTTGAVTLTAARFDNAQSFYAATVTASGGAPQNLVASLYGSSNAFYAPSVGSGLSFDGYAVTGYVADDYSSPAAMASNQFFSPSVEVLGQYVLTTAQAQRLYQVCLLHGLIAGVPLTVSQTARVAGTLEQAVVDGGGLVTISTTSTQTGTSLNIGAMVDDLAALHGLTASLIVTPTSRIAGTITQTMTTVGTTTTVARV